MCVVCLCSLKRVEIFKLYWYFICAFLNLLLSNYDYVLTGVLNLVHGLFMYTKFLSLFKNLLFLFCRIRPPLLKTVHFSVVRIDYSLTNTPIYSTDRLNKLPL